SIWCKARTIPAAWANPASLPPHRRWPTRSSRPPDNVCGICLCVWAESFRMQSSNEQVLHHLHDWLAADRFCWLVTIAATWGSSPRPAGSLLVWSQQATVGSLSGGCVEDELLEKLARNEFASDRIHQVTYGIPADEASRLRLPCGGSLSLILEPLAPTAANQAHAATMIDWLQQRQGFIRSTPLNGPAQPSTLQ